METRLNDDCSKYLLAIGDTMDILSGKWKIKILIVLLFKGARFGEILKYLEGLTPRMLSKELSDLETNGLVERIVKYGTDFGVEYRMTASGHTLSPVIETLHAWGEAHRKRMSRA